MTTESLTKVDAMPAPVPLRNARERVLQTLLFEAGGLLLVTPLVAWVTGAHAGESLLLLVALSVAVMLWAAIYNTVFDRLEARIAGRVASARPHRLRMLHALGLEVSSVLGHLPDHRDDDRAGLVAGAGGGHCAGRGVCRLRLPVSLGVRSAASGAPLSPPRRTAPAQRGQAGGGQRP